MTLTLEAQLQDRCLVLPGVSWSQLEAIEAAFEDVGGVRFFFLDGILEIMTIGEEHEETNSTIGLLLEAYMREKGIRFYVEGGSTLGGREQVDRSILLPELDLTLLVRSIADDQYDAVTEFIKALRKQ